MVPSPGTRAVPPTVGSSALGSDPGTITGVSAPLLSLFSVHSVSTTELMLHYDDPDGQYRGQRLGVVEAVITADGLALHPDPLTGNKDTDAAVRTFLAREAKQSPADVAVTLVGVAHHSNNPDRVTAAAAVLAEPDRQVRVIALQLLDTHRYTDALAAARTAVGNTTAPD